MNIADRLYQAMALLDEVIAELEAEENTITLYSQRDERWRETVYSGGMTFGQAGCFVTCVAMIASAAGYPDTPPEVAKKLSAAGCFSGALLSYPDRIPNAYPKLKYGGTLDWRKRPADIIRLRQEIEHSPTIIEVEFAPGGAEPPQDQHFVVLESLDGGDATILDPWDGARTRLMQRYALASWDVARSIYGARLLEVK